MELTLAKKEIVTMVIGAQWNLYLSTLRKDGEKYRALLANMGAFINELSQAEKKVILVLNIPTGEELAPKYMVHRQLGGIAFRSGGIGVEALRRKYGNIQDDLLTVAKQSGAAEVINPTCAMRSFARA
jgi:SGNH domain (fused to AT3 domains)